MPSYTSPFTTNQGFSLPLFSLSSARLIWRFTPSFFMLISFTGSCSTGSSPWCLSPQLPFVKSPPAFLTLSIQPPALAGCVGCSNFKRFPSFVIATRNHGLFIIPRTDQYISRGWAVIASSIARTRSASLSSRSETGMERDQNDQQ